MKAFLRTAAGWIAAAVLFCVPAQAKPALSARHAVLVDGATGRILYEQGGSERALIASTTKIMTGILIAEECDLQAEVAVPKEAVGVEGSSLYLREGEVITVEALLYGMMLHSGNDAAVALAMYSAGSLEAFAGKMNEKARELGLTGTHFVNPHGLDAEGHYSTALDLARLTAYAMDDPVFHRVVSTKNVTIGQRSLTNHNRMLWRYEGAVGVKTGYTKSAGRILVSAAERDGRRLIAVTIDAPRDWQDHEALLNYGFEQFTQRELAVPGQIMGRVPVICGGEDLAPVVLRDGISCPLGTDEAAEFRLNLPLFVFAPVLAGEQAGSVELLVDGVVMMTIPLYWQYSVWEEA